MSRGKRYTAEQIIKLLRDVEIHIGKGMASAQVRVSVCARAGRIMYGRMILCMI